MRLCHLLVVIILVAMTGLLSPLNSNVLLPNNKVSVKRTVDRQVDKVKPQEYKKQQEQGHSKDHKKSHPKSVNRSAVGHLYRNYTVEGLTWGDNRGTPAYIWGDLTPNHATGDRVVDAYTFMEDNRALFGLENPRQELSVKSVSGGRRDKRFVLFQQYYNGIEVRGATIKVHFNPENRIKVVSASCFKEIDVPSSPTIREEDAIGLLKALDECSSGCNIETPVLKVLPDKQEHILKYYLVWEARLQLPDGLPWIYFIDTETGDLITKRPLFLN